MYKKENGKIWICVDCMYELYGLENILITNEKKEKVLAGVSKIKGKVIKDFNTNIPEGFSYKAGYATLSIMPCDCCNEVAWGTLYRFSFTP